MGTRPALVWLVLLVGAFLTVVAVTTPWRWLPGGSIGNLDTTEGLAPAELLRIRDFSRTMTTLGLCSVVASLTVVLALGFSAWGAHMVRRLPSRGGWLGKVVVATVAMTLISAVVTVPFGVASEHAAHVYGLSTQPWTGWVLDQLTGTAVSLVEALLLVLLVTGLARYIRRWWFAGSLLAAGLVIAGSYLYPVIVQPLFVKVTPMAAGPLRTSLLSMARHDGVPVNNVEVAAESRRTTSLNAYVSGFGASREIVVYDTLLKSQSPAAVRLVVAHELGHAKADDVLHGTIDGALGAAAGVTGLALLLDWRTLRRRAGVAGAHDAAAVPLIVALVAAGTFLSSPLVNTISRSVEARADVHSLDVTRDPATFVKVQEALARSNLSNPTPNPLLYVWYATHPTTPQRLGLAQAWARLHGVPVPRD